MFTEVVEHACSITSLQQGETASNISKDMDTVSYRVPLGVCAGIAPYVVLSFFLVFGCLFGLTGLALGPLDCRPICPLVGLFVCLPGVFLIKPFLLIFASR